MRRSEMQWHHEQQLLLEAQIRQSVQARDFAVVFSSCIQAFQHIVAANKYRKVLGQERELAEEGPFTVICTYAPPLFEHTVLMSLLEFVTATRALQERNSRLRVIEEAIEREETARKFWNYVECRPGVSKQELCSGLPAEEKAVEGIAEVWLRCGIVERQPGADGWALRLRTDLDAQTLGKCPACGATFSGRKEAFLAIRCCGQCGVQNYFHIKYSEPR